MKKMDTERWLFTENPAVMFENTKVGRCKKEVWDATPRGDRPHFKGGI